MADKQLRGNKIRVYQVRARKSLRKYYKPSKVEYFAICKYCLLEISYKNDYPALLVHLTTNHTELLTEAEKTNRNIYWIWDYFTPTSYGGRCKICHTKITNVRTFPRHLNFHRRKHNIFDPDEVIYKNTYMYGASTSASGCMIVEDAEYQEASIPMASNLTDDTDRTCVPNESATKTSEPSEYVASPLENIESIMDDIKVPAALKPLYDIEEVADGEELPVGEELPDVEELSDGEEFLEVEGLIELFDQQPSNIYNDPLDPEG